MNVSAQSLESVLVAPYLRLIFSDLNLGRVVPAVKDETIAVLLQLPLIALQFALINMEVNSAPRLS